MRLRDPDHLFFDQIAVTYGFVGNYSTPNFFERGAQLLQTNYHQFLLEKRVAKRLKLSADYTSENRTDTIREAALMAIPETHVLDSARLELYQRVNSVVDQGAKYGTGAGFGLTGSKPFHKRVQRPRGQPLSQCSCLHLQRRQLRSGRQIVCSRERQAELLRDTVWLLYAHGAGAELLRSEPARDDVRDDGGFQEHVGQQVPPF